MDGIEGELDEILLMIERMQDEEMKEKINARYKTYREQFENYASSVNAKAHGLTPLFMEIIQFSTEVKSYVDGSPTADPLQDFHISKLDTSDKRGEKSKRIQEMEDILIDILDSQIKDGNSKRLQNLISLVQTESKELNIKNQRLDQKIAESMYVLMKNLLVEGKTSEATELTKQFDTDMSIFLLRKLLPQISELRNSGRAQDALFLAKYCEKGEPKETDLKFWERLINIEEPEKNYTLPEKEEKLPQPKRETIRARAKERIKQIREDRRHERESNIKVMHIRYDPLSDFHNMNKKDYRSVLTAIRREYVMGHEKKKPNVRVVFDEGITEVGLATDGYGIVAPLLQEVEIPSTARNIYPCGFYRCTELKKVDMSRKPNLIEIGYAAFCETGIEKIDIPDSLEIIGHSAFKKCGKLETIDLSRCQIKEIKDETFARSRISFFIFPSSLKKINSRAFYACGRIKEIDLSGCKLEYIADDAIDEKDRLHIIQNDELSEKKARIRELKEQIKGEEATKEWLDGIPLPEKSVEKGKNPQNDQAETDLPVGKKEI